MKVAFETITPATALEMLKGNTHNRRLRQTLVSQYAKDMASGRWLQTHQGIAINCDGTILDGQHRLAAIAESGVSQTMLVARGVPASAQVAMDDHARRNCADALTLDRGVEISAAVVAIAKGACELSSGMKKCLTRHETAATIDELKPALDFIKEYLEPRQRGVTSSAVWSAVAVSWFYVAELERLREFCLVLTGREMPGSDSDRAAVILREWLLRTGALGGGKWRMEAFKKTQRAVVAFAERQDISKLYGTAVHYPWPLVDPIR
jgi:hypothetical protein